jgi:DHA1 family bicyclomycin/chloramphenicol resistance-like MFS transporter
MLAFVLIGEVGMTPTAFGIGMLMQSGAYFSGSVALRYISRRIGDRRSAKLGLCFSGGGGVLIALSVLLLPASFLSIMGPVAICTFGIALLTPYIITAVMAPFPHIAGSASAMMGFIQMSSGFLGGVAASVIGDPLLAFGTVIPVMEFMAVASYIAFASASRKVS